MRKLIIALVVLAGLFIAADRVLVSAAESVVARRVQVAAGLEREPTVRIRGFPFLTQAVQGVYQRVDISMATLSHGDARLRNLAAHLRDVHAPLSQMLRRGDSVTVRAESATASAVVPYATVEESIPGGVDVRRAGERLRLTSDVTLFGQQLSARALVGVSVRKDQVMFQARRVRVAGRTVTDQLAERFSFAVDVGQLPFGLNLTGVSVASGGVAVTAEGKDLLLTEQGTAARAHEEPATPRGSGFSLHSGSGRRGR